MKVLFIEPPGRYLRTMGSLGKHKADFLWQPFDHLVMAGYLRKELPRVDFEILDARDKDLKFVKKGISHYNPDVVVFNTCVTSIDKDLDVATVAKQVNREIKTVFTGQVLKVLGEYALSKNPFLDYAIVDPEPEYALVHLLKTKFRPKTGVAFRENGKIRRLPFSPKIMNLDELGFPAHDKVDNTKYYDILQRRSPFALVYGSRGCRHSQCIMCSCPWNFAPMRLRSVEKIIEELKWITSEFGIRDVKWWDAEINQDLAWCKKLFTAMIKEGIDLTWQANFSADLAPMWLLKLMKKAGCYHLAIGLESANEQVLKNVRKGITPEQIERLVKKLKEVGIDFSLYSLIGLPGETKETIEETREFVRKLGCVSTFGIVVPNPGTEFYDWICKRGYLRTCDYSKYDSDLPPVFEYPNLSAEEMYEASRKGYRMFLSPRYVMKRLLKVRSLRELKILVRTGVKFLKR